MGLQQSDQRDLKKAKRLLENPGIAAKITNLIGMPIEKGFKLLPENWSSKIWGITQSALTKATHTAVFTMKNSPGQNSSNIWHKSAAAETGGVGGFFGLPAMALELPITTTIITGTGPDVSQLGSPGEVL